MNAEIHVTTVRMPKTLWKELRRAGTQSSINAVIVEALTVFVAAHQRETIDASFAGIATDSAYQKLMLEMAR